MKNLHKIKPLDFSDRAYAAAFYMGASAAFSRVYIKELADGTLRWGNSKKDVTFTFAWTEDDFKNIVDYWIKYGKTKFPNAMVR